MNANTYEKDGKDLLELNNFTVNKIIATETGDFRGLWVLFENGESLTIGTSRDTDSVSIAGDLTGDMPAITGNASVVLDALVSYLKQFE